MTSPIPQLRRMTPGDLDFADHLRALVGWNQTRADWLRFLAAEPEGCFVAELDGEPVGTATTLRYGSDLAWIGMVLVHPERRQRGVGRSLLLQCMEFLRASGVRRIRLDATPQGRPVYEALGFQAEFVLTRWEISERDRSSEDRASTPDGLKPWKAGDAERVEELDRQAFGAGRRSFLESLGRASTAGWVGTSTEGKIDGYGLIRPGARARYLGPVVARTGEVGLRLVRALLAESGDEPVFWDIPEFQEGAVRWAEGRGFRKQRVLTRMVFGSKEDGGSIEPRWQWAISGPETG